MLKNTKIVDTDDVKDKMLKYVISFCGLRIP